VNAKPARDEAGELMRTELPDRGCKGLYLVIQPGGAKSWAVRYRYQGRPRKLTLGPVASETGEAEPADHPEIDRPLSLAAARLLAAGALREVEKGIDPAKTKQIAVKAGAETAAAKAADTVDNLKTLFIERYAKRQNRSWEQTEWIFDKLVLPAWKGRTVHDITKRDVIDLVESIEQDRPILANRTLAAVRKWFNWLAARDVIKASPCAGVAPPAKETARDRRFTDDEIKTMWAACGKSEPDGGGGIGEPFGSFVRLLLLTGQRRSEVAGMRWSEIDAAKRMWTIPGERTKNKLVHLVPLPDQVLSIIGGVTRIAESDFVFTTTGTSGLGGFSRAKSRLDERMTKPRAEEPADHEVKPAKLKPWTFHDLRRTTATGMADIGIAPHIVEAVLNHVSGHRAGVAGIYNRAQYLPEKARAMQLWADHIDHLVSKKPGAKVIPIGSLRK
jgi:integrase